MSLFNQIASLLGGEKINQFKTVLEWVETQGGIEGLVKQFNSAGLSELIQSWISTGSNLPINAEQIVQVFSSPVINELAAKINMNTAEPLIWLHNICQNWLINSRQKASSPKS